MQTEAEDGPASPVHRPLGVLIVIIGLLATVATLSADAVGWSDPFVFGRAQIAGLAGGIFAVIAGILLLTLLGRVVDNLVGRIVRGAKARRVMSTALYALAGLIGAGFVIFYLVPSLLVSHRLADGLNQPVYAVPMPGGSGDWYILERSGTVRMLIGGRLQAEPFLDLSERVDTTAAEQGLLGMVLAPDFEESGYFYVFYTGYDLVNYLVRFQTSGAAAEPSTDTQGVVLLEVPQLRGEHNGGLLTFGPDGYLYLGTGDSSNKEGYQAQDLSLLTGKMLRLDVYPTVSEPPYYRIPPDNPFVDVEDARPEIWAYGLRNPWRYSFDVETDTIYIADVGQWDVEELNILPVADVAGSNFGWNWYEGNTRYEERVGTPPDDVVFPAYTYPHPPFNCAAVIGGYVYRGARLPELDGVYIFADFCVTGVSMLTQGDNGRWQTSNLIRSRVPVSSFAESEEGEIFILYYNGEFHELVRHSPMRVWLDSFER